MRPPGRVQAVKPARRHVAVASAVLALATVVAAACGDDGTAPVGSTPVDLEITLVDQDSGRRRDATLRCEAGRASGTGHLEDEAAAACDLLSANPEARTRLIEGEPPGRMCAQVYGGPQRAEIRGRVDGRAVDTVVERNDGCGIADWNLLMPLLPPPEDV
jgi:hypothetical protein